MRYVRFFTIIILLVFAGNFCCAQETAQKEEWPAYLLSILIGFGTGHFYLGDSHGFYFLIGEITGYAIFAGGFIFMLSRTIDLSFSDQMEFDPSILCIGYSIVFGGAIILAVSRIWEIIDIFRSVEQAKAIGKIARFKPIIDIQPAKTFVGISYKY